jgi:hypothetical protein
MKTRSCNILCQCERCRAHVEMSGLRFNGTLRLEDHERVSMQAGNLIDICGGRLHLFSVNKADRGTLKIIYSKKIRGRPKNLFVNQS